MADRSWRVGIEWTKARAVAGVRPCALGLALVCAALLVALGAAWSESVHAATSAAIVVNSLADGAPANDGNCTLREAITNANNNNQSGSTDCAAGSGADSITFSVSGTITLGSSLPAINDDLTIDGTGQSITISGNHAVQVMVVNGGKTATLNKLTVANGQCDSCDGGGVYNSGTLTVTNSTLSGNSVNNAGLAYAGGGIYNNGGTLNVSNSTFSGNSAAKNGRGGGIWNGGTLNVSNSTFSGNSANQGGGISNAGPLTVSNSTFSGNSAGLAGGGGIFNGGTLNVSNSTFSGNGAAQYGGGIDTTGTTALKNTIVANSTSGPDCGLFLGTLSADSHNLDSDGSCDNATTKTTGQINLRPLADNGGLTPTMALGAGSAAIDAGDDVVCAAAPVSGKDQRGVTRPQGAHCDIGAYEVETAQAGPNFVVTLAADADSGVCGPVYCTLREAINAANSHGGADTITFSLGGTILLGATLPAITDDVSIDGTGQSITVSGNGAVRVLVVSSGSVTLNRLTIANGYCNGTNGNNCYGGGISSSGTLTVTNSTVRDNVITCTGVGYVPCFASGGGIYNNGGSLTVANSTFSGNSTSASFGLAFGGAIYNAGILNLTNSTLGGNSAISAGGGIFNAGTATLQNTIVANGTGGDCANSGTLSADSHDLDSDGSCDNATTKTTVQINLQPLANNGGSTWTMALGAGSAAIDAGDNTGCPSADQRGVSRPQDGNLDGSAICDIGAYEVNSQLGPTFIVNVSSDHDDSLCGVTDCTLREAINAANAAAGANTITFNIPNMSGCNSANVCTIVLSSTLGTLPAIGDALIIDGSANAASITVSGNHAVRVLLVNSLTAVTLKQLTIANGRCDTCDGGGIYNLGTLTVTSSTFTGNTTTCLGFGCPTFGGAILNIGTMIVTGTTLSGNSAAGAGGGIYHTGSVLTLANSTFGGNSATDGGGLLANSDLALAQAVTTSDDFYLAGNFANSGTFVQTAGTTTFASTGQSITGGGSTTFNHLRIDSLGTAGVSLAANINLTGNFTDTGKFIPAGGRVTFNGTDSQRIVGSSPTSFGDLWLNNSGAGVSLGQDITVTNRLTLTSDLTTTAGAALYLGVNATTSGPGDVWGRTIRAHAFNLNTTYAFGNPFVSLNFTSGTPPGQISVDLTRTLPFSFTNAVIRVYGIEPVGGSGYVARLRLRYRDSELNGNVEGALQLWRSPGGGAWTALPPTAFDLTDNWVEHNNVTALSAWAISQLFPISRRVYLPLVTRTQQLPFP